MSSRRDDRRSTNGRDVQRSNRACDSVYRPYQGYRQRSIHRLDLGAKPRGGRHVKAGPRGERNSCDGSLASELSAESQSKSKEPRTQIVWRRAGRNPTRSCTHCRRASPPSQYFHHSGFAFLELMFSFLN